MPSSCTRPSFGRPPYVLKKVMAGVIWLFGIAALQSGYNVQKRAISTRSRERLNDVVVQHGLTSCALDVDNGRFARDRNGFLRAYRHLDADRNDRNAADLHFRALDRAEPRQGECEVRICQDEAPSAGT